MTPELSSSLGVSEPLAQTTTARAGTSERITAAAFGQRRKMLRGSLRSVGGERLLAAAGIDGVRRAETLSVDEFARLATLSMEGA